MWVKGALELCDEDVSRSVCLYDVVGELSAVQLGPLLIVELESCVRNVHICNCYHVSVAVLS